MARPSRHPRHLFRSDKFMDPTTRLRIISSRRRNDHHLQMVQRYSIRSKAKRRRLSGTRGEIPKKHPSQLRRNSRQATQSRIGRKHTNFRKRCRVQKVRFGALTAAQTVIEKTHLSIGRYAAVFVAYGYTQVHERGDRKCQLLEHSRICICFTFQWGLVLCHCGEEESTLRNPRGWSYRQELRRC